MTITTDQPVINPEDRATEPTEPLHLDPPERSRPATKPLRTALGWVLGTVAIAAAAVLVAVVVDDDGTGTSVNRGVVTRPPATSPRPRTGRPNSTYAAYRPGGKVNEPRRLRQPRGRAEAETRSEGALSSADGRCWAALRLLTTGGATLSDGYSSWPSRRSSSSTGRGHNPSTVDHPRSPRPRKEAKR